VATKTGIKVELVPEQEFAVNGRTPSLVRARCEASLKRLGFDCIDLFYLHCIASHRSNHPN
jgi:aryl-alcohol dehydrogenase-like predicted oxidoreductase